MRRSSRCFMQRERGELFRSHRLQLQPGDSVHLNLNYTPIVVSDSEYLRQSECAKCGERRHERQPSIRQRRQCRSALEDRHFQYRADLHATDRAIMRFSTLAPMCERISITTIPATIRLPILGRRICKLSRSAQYRTLTNAGSALRRHLRERNPQHEGGREYRANVSARERQFGMVDPTYNAPCVDANGNSVPGYSSPRLHATAPVSRIPTTFRCSRPMT